MPETSMPIRRAAVLVVLACFVAAPALLPMARAADEPTVQPSEKWYEESLNGRKTGHRRVVWAPSTWKGKKTVHDTTTVVSVTQRDMAGMKDQFETTVTSDLERGEDGTLWWMRTRQEEGGRVTVAETTWTGEGYVHVARIEGQADQRIEVKLDKPVLVDAEAFLGRRARDGKLKEGDTYKIRQLDLRARTARDDVVTIGPMETIEDGTGAKVECFKLTQRDTASGREILLWLDRKGVFLQVRMGNYLIRRTSQEKAEDMPARPAEYTITVPASPRLERIFSADRVLADVHVRHDEHRKLPAFPKSPWSRVTAVEGDAESGHVVRMELTRHDNEGVKALIPVTDPKFERHLEATALMQTEHPLVKKTVEKVVGDEKNARRAAHLLARFVFRHLHKQSLEVSQGDAVKILEECRGDCSEHALLFVALCRAAGIPARQCSGYVCIGGIWGAHAWAEIWTGAWIGADPTTGEVGTAARYIFFGYPEEPGSFPGVVSSRASGRLRILTRRVEEGPAGFDLDDDNKYRIYDRENARYLHVLAGLEARDVPEGWSVDLNHDRIMRIRGEGFTAQLRASADQGEDLDTVGRYGRGSRTTFAGAPALLRKQGSSRSYIVHSRRRLVLLYVGGADDDKVAELEKVLAPTFADPPMAWDEPASEDGVNKDEEKSTTDKKDAADSDK